MQIPSFGVSRSPCFTNLNDWEECQKIFEQQKTTKTSCDWKANVVFRSLSDSVEPKLLDSPLPVCCRE